MTSDSDTGNSTRSATSGVRLTRYEQDRYEIDTAQDFDAFVERFESAAPTFDPAMVAEADSWRTLVDQTASVAVHGFLIYAAFKDWPWAHFDDVTGLDKRRGAMYLMGNHAVAETMYRYNPGIMLHAPLRLMVFENDAGNAVFTIGRPSDQFSAYGDPRIAETGKRLDRMLAGLLSELEVPVPEGLDNRARTDV